MKDTAPTADPTATENAPGHAHWQRIVNDLYRQRAYILAFLAGFFPAAIQPSEDTTDPGFVLLRLRVGDRWLFWHLAVTDLDLFADVHRADDEDPDNVWDGHTTDEKNAYLLAYAALNSRTPCRPPGSPEEVLEPDILDCTPGHVYESTACWHASRIDSSTPGQHEAVRVWLRKRCRHTCKFCGDRAKCISPHHPWNQPQEAA